MEGKCVVCGNETIYVSKRRGYRKTCSKNCHDTINKIRFRELSAAHTAHALQTKSALINSAVDSWKHEYVNSSLTIKEIAKKFEMPYGTVRRALSDLGLTKKHNKCARRREFLKVRFSDIIDLLHDEDYINSRIQLGYGGKQFAEELGCSTDFVVSTLRNAGRPLRRRTESNCEVRFKEFLKSLGIGFRSNCRSLISPYELDVVIDSHALAIEINGIYWHSRKSHESKNYHVNKTDRCNAVGYDCIQLHDCDMFFPSIQNVVKSRLGIFDRRIYARAVQIKEISSDDYRKFCNENHVQRWAAAAIKIGSFFNDELIAVMSFSKSRFNKKYDFEMIRYCNKIGVSIVGGAAKLFSYFQKKYLKHGQSCISYCDRRLFNGGVYSRLGFTHLHNTPPGYFWINDSGNILSRYQTQKHKLDTNLTETQHMTQLRYHKIYDCGQSVWVFNKY